MQPQQKRTVYIGGLPEEVDDKILYNTFLPFGPILEVNVPPDYNSKENKHRGFGFVEFESAEDAAAAVDNMDESELFGRTIRVNLARPKQIKEGWSRPIWSEDKWLVKHAGETLPPDTANKQVEGSANNAGPPGTVETASNDKAMDVQI